MPPTRLKCAEIQVPRAHVKHEHAGAEGGDGDEGHVCGDVGELALYPAPALRTEKRPVDCEHEPLHVHERHDEIR